MLIAAVKLSVGLLQQGRPKFAVIRRLDKSQSSVDSGELQISRKILHETMFVLTLSHTLLRSGGVKIYLTIGFFLKVYIKVNFYLHLDVQSPFQQQVSNDCQVY